MTGIASALQTAMPQEPGRGQAASQSPNAGRPEPSPENKARGIFSGAEILPALSADAYKAEIEEAFSGFDLQRYSSSRPIHQAAMSAVNATRAWVRAAIEGRGRGLVLWAADHREEESGKIVLKSSEGLTLYSFGNGKSRLAKSAANALYAIQSLDKYQLTSRPFRNGIYRKTKNIKQEIIASYGKEDYSRYMAQFWRAEFLILDDLGTEAIKDESRAWWQGELYSIIDYACERGIPLMITSNMLPDQIGEWVGGKVFDRLQAMTNGREGFINLSIVPSQRRKSYAENWKE